MVGLKPSDVPPPLGVKMASAGAAACIADIVTFPLDTAKVRLQVSAHKREPMTWLSTQLSTLLSLPQVNTPSANNQIKPLFGKLCKTVTPPPRFRERRRRWKASATEACLGPSAPWSGQRGPGLCTTGWWRVCRDNCASPLSESACTTPSGTSTPAAKKVSPCSHWEWEEKTKTSLFKVQAPKWCRPPSGLSPNCKITRDPDAIRPVLPSSHANSDKNQWT